MSIRVSKSSALTPAQWRFYEYNTASSQFLSWFSASKRRSHSTQGRNQKERKKGGRGSSRQFLICAPLVCHQVGGGASSVCAAVWSQRRGAGGREDRVGLFKGSRGRKGSALGLLAAFSIPLSTLVHLHLCQLDVSQHVGVWDGDEKADMSRNHPEFVLF